MDFLGFRYDLSLSLVVLDVPLRACTRCISVFDLSMSWGLVCFPCVVLVASVLVLVIGGVDMSRRRSTVLLTLGVN